MYRNDISEDVIIAIYPITLVTTPPFDQLFTPELCGRSLLGLFAFFRFDNVLTMQKATDAKADRPATWTSASPVFPRNIPNVATYWPMNMRVRIADAINDVA